MTDIELDKYKVTRRPYPKDKERCLRVKKAMLNYGIETIKELAKALNLNYKAVAEVVNGTRRSKKTERRIAAFFKMEVEDLFPKRSKQDLAKMNMKQQLGGRAC